MTLGTWAEIVEVRSRIYSVTEDDRSLALSLAVKRIAADEAARRRGADLSCEDLSDAALARYEDGVPPEFARSSERLPIASLLATAATGYRSIPAVEDASPTPGAQLSQPSRQQIQAGMGRITGAVRACANGQPGLVMLRVTFASDGSVSNTQVSSGPFAGTPAAACMENAARAARVPAFTNASVTVSYPIMVQPPDPADDDALGL